MKHPKVIAVTNKITEMAEEIESYFVAGAKVTILVRHGAINDADMLITNDNFKEITDAVDRADKREKRERQ